jgi:hypothetical protein
MAAIMIRCGRGRNPRCSAELGGGMGVAVEYVMAQLEAGRAASPR